MTVKSKQGDGAPAGKATGRTAARESVVSIVFTPQQIAYLEERMCVVAAAPPTRRVGGSNRLGIFAESLAAS